jgi:acyl-CoA synthetase (AMP-forming)/AMP-acid ligase II
VTAASAQAREPRTQTGPPAGVARNATTLLERVALSPRATRVAFSCDGEHRTFGQVHERSLRLARGLAASGVSRGDAVAVLLPNRHEWPEVLFALASLGAVCVPVNILLRASEVDFVLDDSDARCLIADGRSSELLGDLANAPELVIGIGGLERAATHPYEELIARSQPWNGTGADLDHTMTLFYTSGTTGKPKAAEHTHNGILWNAFSQIPDLGLTSDDVYLCVASLSWAAGFHDVVLPLVWLGGRSVLFPTGGATVDRIAAVSAEEGVTHAFLVPTLLKQLIGAPTELARLRETALRWIITGGEPVPRTVIETLNEELPGCRVVQGYGLSEFPTIATALRPEESLTHAGSAGRPLSITQLAIRHDDGAIAPSGEGEVLLRSLATMRRYHNHPAETEEAFRDGWLHTGDLGIVDDAGYLTITGRRKDMIISGGLNVYPKEIEEVIYRVPGVAEAAVVGVEDSRWGEVPVAVVVPTSDGFDVAAAASACREALATFKCPSTFLVRSEPLPRNPSGKLLKRELRPWAAHEVATRSATAAPVSAAPATEVQR